MEDKTNQVSGGTGQPTVNNVVDPNAALSAPITVATTPQVPQAQPQVIPTQAQPVVQNVTPNQVQQPQPQPQSQVQNQAQSQPQPQNHQRNVELPSININQQAKQPNTQQAPSQAQKPVQTPNVVQAPVQEELKSQKRKRFFMFFFFILLIAFVFFLDEVTDVVQSFLNREEVVDMENVTTGRLRCELSRTTEDLNLEVVANFEFVDRGLISLEQDTTHTGEAAVDTRRITELREQCLYLRDNILEVDGITVVCNTGSNSVMRMTETFRFELIDPSQISAAYAEAGGTLPEFTLNQDISRVRESMERAGYTCELL